MDRQYNNQNRQNNQRGRRSRSRDRDYNNRDNNQRYNRRSQSRSRSRDRNCRGGGGRGGGYGPEEDYDSRDARSSNYSSSSSNYRMNDRHGGRGGRQDDYRGGGGGGNGGNGGGFDRREYNHHQQREKGGYSRASGGNYSPNSGGGGQYNQQQQQQPPHGRDRMEQDDDYDSYESDDGGRYTSQTPHNKIVVRGLPQHITEADIVSDLMQFNLKPLSIRLIRRKNTGASRGFAFVEFSTEEEATRWMNYKQGVLMLDQYRAVLQYSNPRGGSGGRSFDDRRGGGQPGGNGNNNSGSMDNTTDWYCSKCLVFNFKRRENCFKCYASREESQRGGDGWDEISQVLTKKIILRNLDVLTNEEVVLTIMQEILPLEQVAKISKILICRDPLTNTSRGICYLSFDTLVDSMNVHNSLQALDPPLTIDERSVRISYCVDGTTENPEGPGGGPDKDPKGGRKQHKGMDYQQSQNNYYGGDQSMSGDSFDMHSSSSVQGPVAAVNTYQYTLADVPRLAEYGAKMYATNAAEHEHYYKYYTEYYTGEIQAGNYVNLPLVSQLGAETANSGAAVAQSAMQRKQQQQQGKKQRQQNQSYDATSYVDPQQQQMYWDGENWTYPGQQAAPAPATPTVSLPEPEKRETPSTEPEGRAPDKVKHAKNIVKDMEKWAKQLNQKKNMGGGGGPLQLPVPVKEEHPIRPGGALNGSGGADVGFAILEKKETVKIPLTPQLISGRGPTSSAISAAAAGSGNKNVVAYGSDSDNEGGDQQQQQEGNNGFVANEKDYVDFKKLACLLCKRAFQSEEILSKHIKMSDLHKQNLAKVKGGAAGGAPTGGAGGSSAGAGSGGELDLSYRDRAKERRAKYGEADPAPLNKSRERFHKEIEKQASAAALAAQSASVAQTPIGGGNVGNKLLQKMGWKDGQGLGRANQGRTNIIEVESRAGGAGLGTKSAGPPWAGGDYKSYIKKMMKQRYEQAE